MALRIQEQASERHAPTVPDGWRLQAETRWLVQDDDASLACFEQSLPARICKRLCPGVLELRFVNHVGVFPIQGVGNLHVYSGKWSANDYDAMLGELIAHASALPFTASDGGRVPYDRRLVDDVRVLYHAFIYLRWVLSDAAPASHRLTAALEAVLREPHRKMERHVTTVPVHLARVPTARSFERIVTGAEPLQRTGSTRRIARALRGHMPVTVQQRTQRVTFDTAENRFVLAFVEQALAIVQRVRENVRKLRRPSVVERIRREADAMESKLARVQAASMWAEVGRMVRLPANSTVLQRRRGYRDIYRHFLRLRSAATLPLSKDAPLDLIEVRDIATLYELWCFFEVVQSVTRMTGAPPTRAELGASHFGVSVPYDYRVAWSSGNYCCYNLRFSPKHAGTRNSWSVRLRPDIALWIEVGAARGFHIFDAKFKLRKLAGWSPDESADEKTRGDERDEKRGDSHNVDLHKMHTYRDALPEVRSARILYPGTAAKWFASTGADSSSVEGLCGVGAVPLIPGREHATLGDVLRRLLSKHDARQQSGPGID